MNSSLILKQDRIEVRSHIEKSFRRDIVSDTFKGLTAPRKYIPSKYFYDAAGSKLFDKICNLPE